MGRTTTQTPNARSKNRRLDAALMARPLRYLEDAADLRIAIEYNLQDNKFAENDGRIVYLMDANVVRLFMSPATEVRRVAPFAADTSEHLKATAVVTAEYLFSRQLPGQRGAPVLITPGHADDLGFMIGALMHETEGSPADPTELTKREREDLQNLVASLSNRSDYDSDDYRNLREQVTKLAAQIGTFNLALQLHRLYDEDLMRPLALHPYAIAEILDRDDHAIKSWTHKIHTERLLTTKNREATRTGARGSKYDEHAYKLKQQRENERLKKDQRDAEAIVQIEKLNRIADKEEGKRRYVLVTGDRTLQRIYATWFWSAENPDQRPEKYALRQPIQYLPILNVADMPNRVRTTLIDQTQAALDTLLANIRDIDTRYPYTLTDHSARIFKKRTAPLSDDTDAVSLFFSRDPYPVKIDRRALEETIKNWSECFRESVMQNALLLRRRAHAEFAPLVDLLDREPNLRLAILQEQRRLLLRVEFAHLAMGTHLNLQALPRLGEQAVKGPGRGPFSIRMDFTDLVGPMHLPADEALDALVRDPATLAGISRRLQRVGNYNALFFGACVAFRCAQWHATRQHVHRALNFLRAGAGTDEPRQEMRHLLAVAIRFSMRQADEFEEANDILVDAAEYFGKVQDPLGQARALSERATLNLWVLQQSLVPKTEKMRVTPTREHNFVLISELLKTAGLDERCQKGGAWFGAWRTVNMQHAANVIGSELLGRVFGLRIPSSPPGLVETAMETVDRESLTGGYPKLLSLAVLMLRWHSMKEGDSRAELGRAIRDDGRRLVSDPSAGELTDLDRWELQEYARIIDRTLLPQNA